MGRGWKNSETQDRKSKTCCKQIIGRNVNIKVAVSEVTEKNNEEHLIENWRNDSSYYMVENAKLKWILQLHGKQNF